jgi:hypothetical protein
MTDMIQQFFAAWGETDATARRKMIEGAMTPDFVYSDPRSPERLTTFDSLFDYVSMFGEMAPGWVAQVVQSDSQNDFTRVIVGFGDGSDIKQHGTYFADLASDGKIALLTGFVGAGGLNA